MRLSNVGERQTHIILPKRTETEYLYYTLFKNNRIVKYIDMSLITFKATTNGFGDHDDFEKSISAFFFGNDTNLETVILPKSQNTIIYTAAFSGCCSLKYVNFLEKFQFDIYASISTQNLFQDASSPVTTFVPTQELKTYYEGFRFNNVKEIKIGTPPQN